MLVILPVVEVDSAGNHDQQKGEQKLQEIRVENDSAEIAEHVGGVQVNAVAVVVHERATDKHDQEDEAVGERVDLEVDGQRVQGSGREVGLFLEVVDESEHESGHDGLGVATARYGDGDGVVKPEADALQVSVFVGARAGAVYLEDQKGADHVQRDEDELAE